MNCNIIAALFVIVATPIAVLAADTKPLDVPLANPGFEKGAEGWSLNAARFPGMIVVAKAQKRAGEASLKISDLKGTLNPYCAQSVKGLDGGAVYRLRAWVMSEKGQTAQAAVKIEFYNDKGTNTGGYYSRVATKQDGSWLPIEVVGQADADTIKATLLLRLFGKGTVYFDDVVYERVKETPRLSLSPRRLAASPRLAANLRLVAHLGKDVAETEPPTLAFEVQRQGASSVAVKADVAAAGPSAWTVTVHLPSLAPGQYLLRCLYPKAKAEDTVFLFVPPEKRKPEYLSDTGTIMVKDQPFFPIGLYHVSPQEYTVLATHGFNCVQGLPTLDIRNFEDSLNQAKAAGVGGIMVDVPLYAGGQVLRNMANSLNKVKTYGVHGSVLDWKLIDEPDIRPDVMDEVPAAYELVKRGDPKHPILLTVSNPAAYAYWANFCDILQVDPYPIPSQPLTMVSDYTAKAKAALQPWQNLTVVLQSGWISDPMNQPTFDQARCMVYLALINGAKGIFWYSMHDLNWDLTKTPLWARFKELNEETLALSQPVMLGTKVEVKGAAAPVQALCLKHEGKHYLLLANPSAAPSEAAVELPFDIAKATPRGKTKVTAVGKTVTVKLPATGAEMVVLEGK